MEKRRFWFPGSQLIFLGLAILGLALLLAACGTTTRAVVSTTAPATPTPISLPTSASANANSAGLAAADVNKLINDKFNTVDTSLALWNIQPGLGTVMMEYSNRLARLYYAANAGNWDMAQYQLAEMTEIQEVGETTRPKRAPDLKKFEDTYLAPMENAITAKDKDAFDKAFNSTISGCNACHQQQTGTNWSSYKYVEIQVPKIDPAPFVDWKGAAQDNHIANPPAAEVKVPAALTGNLDAAGVQKLVNDKFNTVDTSLALWNIQPGLGTVMMEYSERFSRMYFAAKAGNWDMAKYQGDEMLEIQEVGETTRPGRAPALKEFETNYLEPLDKAIQAKDANAFDSAFTATVSGCNNCHSKAKGAEWKSYQFVKVQAPTADNSDFIKWAADKLTGNFIANPAPAATTAPAAAPSGTLSLAGVKTLVDAMFNKPDNSLTIWNIQPGLGTIMMEYSKRMAQVDFSIKAGNWDMAKYQLDEMREIQEVGETTRPGRADSLKKFENDYLNSLDQAILAKDTAKATSAMDNLVSGCNACHSSSKGSDWSSYGFIQVQLPNADPSSYVNWGTANGTGNYKP